MTWVKSTALSPPDVLAICPILTTTVVVPHRLRMALAAADEVRSRNTTASAYGGPHWPPQIG